MIQRTAILEEDWSELDIQESDTVNLIGKFEENKHNTMLLNNKHENYIVVFPDVLLSTTTVGSSFQCDRKAILKSRIKSVGTNVFALIGNITHALLAHAFQQNDFNLQSLYQQLDVLLQKNLDQIYGLGNKTEVELRQEILPMIKALKSFQEKFLRGMPSKEGNITGFSPASLLNRVSIPKVLAVEQSILSPTWGLKGTIDAGVEVLVMKSGPVDYVEAFISPLELKTSNHDRSKNGAGTDAHRAQVLLYSLLMSDYFNTDIKYGLLLYLKSDSLYGVHSFLDQLRSIVKRRNELAIHLVRGILPPMLPNPETNRACLICDYKASCALFHIAENIEDLSFKPSLPDHFPKFNITNERISFFSSWNAVLDLEKNSIGSYRKEMWEISSNARENHGRCLSKMVLQGETKSLNGGNSYTFQKKKSTNKRTTSLLDLHFVEGDYVTIGTEDGVFGLGSGTVSSINESTVIIDCDQPLKNPPMLRPYENGTQTFQGLLEIPDPIRNFALKFDSDAPIARDRSQILWRIDRDEMASGINTAKANLVNLFSDERKMELVVDFRKPVFSPWPIDKSIPSNHFSTLNPIQQEAILKCLRANDFALILGFPGSGKTHTVAVLLDVLINMGKTVLLTAYTHSAVDNLLMKLIELYKIDGKKADRIVRLGRAQSVRHEIRPFVFDSSLFSTVSDLKNFLDSKSIVATTCMGMNHSLLVARKEKFDCCIVDEASQLPLPFCIGPLLKAQIFVLIGDTYQLPPIVKSTEATMLAESLFHILANKQSSVAVTKLTRQYRMNKEIASISNEFVYNGTMVTDEKVAKKTLDLPKMDEFLKSHNVTGWLKEILDPNIPLLFVNTDSVPALETRTHDTEQLRNIIEGGLIGMFAKSFALCGLAENEIGIISPYREQNKVLLQFVHQQYPVIEISTVDRFQGRDKDCIIVSLVRSNEKHVIGTLLENINRLNVMFTRAKCKLIVVGSLSTFAGSESFWPPLLKAFVKTGKQIDLPKDAHFSLNFLGFKHKIQSMQAYNELTSSNLSKPTPVIGGNHDQNGKNLNANNSNNNLNNNTNHMNFISANKQNPIKHKASSSTLAKNQIIAPAILNLVKEEDTMN